jgi:hypothetical protein
MLYRELMAVGSELLTKHTDTLFWRRVDFLILNTTLYIATTKL